MLVNGNQQATLKGAPESKRDLTIDLDWLNQIYEQEADYVIIQNYKQHPVPRIEIVTRDRELVSKLLSFLKQLEIGVHIKDFNSGKTPYTKITIQGIKRCLKAVSLIKNRRSLLLERFCQERLSVPIGTPYTEWQEFGLPNQLRQLNS